MTLQITERLHEIISRYVEEIRNKINPNLEAEVLFIKALELNHDYIIKVVNDLAIKLADKSNLYSFDSERGIFDIYNEKYKGNTYDEKGLSNYSFEYPIEVTQELANKIIKDNKPLGNFYLRKENEYISIEVRDINKPHIKHFKFFEDCIGSLYGVLNESLKENLENEEEWELEY